MKKSNLTNKMLNGELKYFVSSIFCVYVHHPYPFFAIFFKGKRHARNEKWEILKIWTKADYNGDPGVADPKALLWALQMTIEKD